MQETQETRVPSLGQEDPLEKEMAIRSCIRSTGIRGGRKELRVYERQEKYSNLKKLKCREDKT